MPSESVLDSRENSAELLPVSVTLPVYARVPPDQFAASLDSVMNQTVPVAEIIVVADGPLTPHLETVLEKRLAHPRVRVLRLPENKGVASACQAALAETRQPWIARQDADDLSLPDRFERLAPFMASGQYAAIGGSMREFRGGPEHVVGLRRLPLEHDRLVRYARFNSPINNPTVVMDSAAVRGVGGFQAVHLMEDYDLFARLIAHGYRLMNVPEPLVLFRAAPDVLARRRDRRLFAAEWEMQRRLRRYGLIGRGRALLNFALRSGVRLLPAPVFRLLHERVFRKPVDAA